MDDEKSTKMVSELIALASTSIANGMAGAELLRDLWFNQNGYSKHVEKRIKLNHVENAVDYAEKTFKVFSSSNNVTIATSSQGDGLTTGMMKLSTGGWIVLISEDGKIITSYPFESGKETFVERHERMGDKINVYEIPEDTRRILKSLFGDAGILGR